MMRTKTHKLTKRSVLKTLRNMPESFVAEDLIERIVLLEKIERGLEQARNGQGLITMEAKKKLGKWLK